MDDPDNITWILLWIIGLLLLRYLIHDLPTVLQLTRAAWRGEKVDLKQRYGAWAVITGASDGMGKAYAAQLAARGINIALVGRNRDKMQAVATDFENRFGISTTLIIADFTKGRSIYASVKKDLEQIPVGILVNNVGIQYEYPMGFADIPEDDVWDNVHVNVTSATMMTHIVLPKMLAVNKGAIVNISSVSCEQAQPFMNLYAASKAYLTFFSDAVREEVKGSNVTIQTLVPFYVASKINHFADDLLKVNLFIPHPDTWAASAVETLGKIDQTTGYWPHRIEWFGFKLLPPWARTKFLRQRYSGYGRQYLKAKAEKQS